MNKKRICIVCVIVIFAITTGYLFEKKSKEEISMEPDGVSSISMNRDQYLTVVANRDRIEDKEEFAKLLVKMCRENSFHTIKFSTDRGCPYGVFEQNNRERNDWQNTLNEILELYGIDEENMPLF